MLDVAAVGDLLEAAVRLARDQEERKGGAGASAPSCLDRAGVAAVVSKEMPFTPLGRSLAASAVALRIECISMSSPSIAFCWADAPAARPRTKRPARNRRMTVPLSMDATAQSASVASDSAADRGGAPGPDIGSGLVSRRAAVASTGRTLAIHRQVPMGHSFKSQDLVVFQKRKHGTHPARAPAPAARPARRRLRLRDRQILGRRRVLDGDRLLLRTPGGKHTRSRASTRPAPRVALRARLAQALRPRAAEGAAPPVT